MKFHCCQAALRRFQNRSLVLVLAGALGLAFSASAQIGVTCAPSSAVAQVASTGLAEPIGSIFLTCAGGTAGAVASGDLFVTLNTNITNIVDSNGNPQYITVISTGAAVTKGQPSLISATVLQIPGLAYTIPSPSSVAVNITISGIRAAVASLQNGLAATVTASLHWDGFNFGGAPISVASGVTPLLASVQNNAVPCAGSPLPASIDFPTFVYAGTTSSAVRVTEAVNNAFAPQVTTATNGVRIIVNLSGYPAGTQLFVPNALVGSTGSFPTSAGEFGTYPSGGQYLPAASQLLLSYVNGADQNGAGGTLVYLPPATATSFTAMTQLTVTGGSAYAVYEVVDHSATVRQSVQVPVFEVSPAYTCATPPPPSTLSVKEAPVSTVSIASMTDPTPRFIASPLGSDCTQIGDCNSGYYPVLVVNTTPVNITGSSLGTAQNGSITVTNSGGSAFSFTDSVAYQSGTGWLTVTPTAADDGTTATLTLVANPAALQPGTYNATVTINAGAVGSASVPVIFTVGATLPTVTSIENAASFQLGAVAPGSYVALYGANLLGSNVTVTFSNLAASVISDSALQPPNSNVDQINTIIPTALAGQPSSSVVVVVNGQASAPFTATLAANAPGVFTPGIVNSDGSVNAASNPARRGDYVSVYLTGLAVPVAVGSVTVNLGSQTGIVPLYAGAQGTEAALDQINVTIPAGLTFTGNSTPLTTCVTITAGQPICSNTVSLYLQ
jgi:uncharacterized protein (TIGR03437 family)